MALFKKRQDISTTLPSNFSNFLKASCAAGSYICLYLLVLLGTLALVVLVGRRGRPLRATMAQLSLALTTSALMPLVCTRRTAHGSAGTVAPSAA